MGGRSPLKRSSGGATAEIARHSPGKGSALVAAVLISASALVGLLTFLPATVRAATLYVGGTGIGNYTTIREAIAAAHPGDEIFVFSGSYPESFDLPGGISLVGEDRDTTIINGTGIYVGAWANVSGFTLRGNAPYTGVRLRFSDYATIENNAIENYAHGILMNSTIGATIRNNRFAGTGVTIQGPYDRQLRYWNTHSIGSNLVDGRPLVYWRDVVGGTVPAGAGQVILANVTDVRVQSENLRDVPVAIEVGYSSGVAIINNTVSSSQFEGIGVYYSTTSSILYNTVASSPVGIQLWASNETAVLRNTVTDSAQTAIALVAAPGSTVANNTLSSSRWGLLIDVGGTGNLGGGNWVYGNAVSGTINGIVVLSESNTIEYNVASNNSNGISVGSRNVVFRNNASFNSMVGIEASGLGNTAITENVADHNRVGIQLYGSANNVVSRNTARFNVNGILSGSGTSLDTITDNVATGNDYGVTLYLSSGDAVLRNNASGNVQSGIVVGYSDTATVRDNYVADNAASALYAGIYVQASSSIQVFHNIILRNGREAFDDSGNLWDNGYPSGGNFWSDYAGVDNCSGPAQNVCPSPDGIGDTPYAFFNARDRYPLIQPATPPPSQPSEPWGLTGVAGNGSVTLSWNPPADSGGAPIVAYRIHRGNASGAEGFLVEVGNVTTYVDAGLTNGQRYYYQVSAKNVAAEGPRSAEISATPRTTPESPRALAATPGANRVTLTWSPPIDSGGSPLTGYRIYRGTVSGSETLVGETGDAATFTDFGLTNGQRYFYQVSAKNVAGEGPKTAEVTATPAAAPDAPSSFIAIDGNAIVLVWELPPKNGGSAITGYRIYRGTDVNALTLLVSVGVDRTYTDSQVTAGTTYFYQVAAVNSIGEGPRSYIASARAGNHRPFIDVITPANTSVVSGVYSITGVSVDLDGTVQRVEVRVDSGTWAAATGVDSWRYDWDTRVFANGLHAIHVRAYDGADYSVEKTVVVTVDNQASPPAGIFPGEQPWLWAALAIIAAVGGVVAYVLLRRRDNP